VSGEVASYIPELARADANHFAIAVCTIDGEVFEVGDSDETFTIQSISKPLVFGMALEGRGIEAVLGRVGVEPSGNPFNSVTVDPQTSRPFNPMVNAGAIVTTGILAQSEDRPDLESVRATFSRFAGRELEIDERVYASERETGDRNRALAWLMRSFGVLDGDLDAAVDLYFGQCSILVTARDLAVIGATLANAGLNPITGERVIADRYVTHALSVMMTCGMYDNAGQWAFDVGLPAKSGVSGGVLAVLPGQLGFGVYSPPLDVRGNSVRGIKVCEQLSRELVLHVFGASPDSLSAVRRVSRGDEVMSNRVRSHHETAALAAHRRSIGLFEIQGALFFGSAERAHRIVIDELDDLAYVILDLTHVSAIDEAALAILNRLASEIAQTGRTVAVVSLDDGVTAKLSEHALPFVDADAALEWCEEQLLPEGSANDQSTALEDFELLSGLNAAELDAVADVAEFEKYAPGAIVFREGDDADRMYFVLEGRVSVMLPLDTRDRSRRLVTFGPGLIFGETALLEPDGLRSADVVCDEHSTMASLSLYALDRLDIRQPAVRGKVYANLARLLSARLRRANVQIRALAR
jgi:glutaminase